MALRHRLTAVLPFRGRRGTDKMLGPSRNLLGFSSVPREHPRTAHERNVVQKQGQSNGFHDFSKEAKDYGKRVA
jgi:hypothetical protein